MTSGDSVISSRVRGANPSSAGSRVYESSAEARNARHLLEDLLHRLGICGARGAVGRDQDRAGDGTRDDEPDEAKERPADEEHSAEE